MVRTAFVSTYPPRRCGIATFTADLSRVTPDREIVALHHVDQQTPYGMEVHHRIRRDERDDYARTARSLASCADVVSIQHEYGIWGGEDGEWVLDFVEHLRNPAVATLHTILAEPTPRQREILIELIAAVRSTVVMSQAAASMLTQAYGVDQAKIAIIPHGVPDLPMVAADSIKPATGLAGREVILSFGLLGQGKGYELMIDALPAIVAAHPNATYVIVGATHPDLIKSSGEAYRTSLVKRAAGLGMTAHVQFVDRFVGRVELTRWLESADVFVTPYPYLGQIVSGTMSYAMGAGRAIVSTPYTYAAELLGEGRGVLVPPAQPAALAAEVINLLGNPELRLAIGAKAYEYSRRMVWARVGTEYQNLFSGLVHDAATEAAGPTIEARFAAFHA